MRKVVLTHFAVFQLNAIYDYYAYFASKRVASKIKKDIITSIKSLKNNFTEWQIDEFLVDFNKNHRRLVCGNYKIICYYDPVENIIYVTDIFDSRQDPSKEKG